MRISTQQIQQVGIDSILRQQGKLNHTQQQLATGKRVLLPSDDPVGTSQLLQLRQSIETTKQYQANAQAAVNRLQQEEGVLINVTEILQRVRELAVQGNNASQTNETRDFMAMEIRQQLEALLGLANTRDGSGDYLFGGTKGGTQPFVKSAGQYVYQGDQSQRALQIGSERKITDGDPGSAVFQMIRNGNGVFATAAAAANQGTAIIGETSVMNGQYIPSLPNGYTLTFAQPDPDGPITYEVVDSDANVVSAGTYAAGEPIEFQGARLSFSGTPADGDSFSVHSSQYQDVFQTLENLAAVLAAPVHTAADQARLNTSINRALGEIDLALDNVLTVRASVGARLKAIDSQTYVNEGYLVQAQETLSSVEDLDYAEAISRLHMQLTGLEAAQQTYLKVNGLSMFNYLR